MSKIKRAVLILSVIAVSIALVPLFILNDAEFAGSDDGGSKMVSEITGSQYEPWFTPIMETWIGGEIPREVENLIFCIQTGIGVGIICFFMGRLVERSKKESSAKKVG